MLVIHGGAGIHNSSVDKACSSAIKISNQNLINAIMELENNPLLNCGLGSNLTIDGRVECEAAYMSSKNLAFGAVAAVGNCKNPILAAKKLSDTYNIDSPWTLVPPMILVGEGAEKFCQQFNFGIVNNKELICKKALDAFTRAKQVIDNNYFQRLDTVGGCQIDICGKAQAAVSSGGIILKHSGRMGHTAQFGSALWAEKRGNKSIAIALSGCGEALTRTHLAENLAAEFFEWTEDLLLPQRIKEFFTNKYINSIKLSAFPKNRILFGGTLLLKNSDEHNELLVFHNTPEFIFAYSSPNSKTIKRHKTILTNLDDVLCDSYLL